MRKSKFSEAQIVAVLQEGEAGLPKNPLQFAATFRPLVQHEGFDASVPISAKRFLSAMLGRLSGGLGYRAVYPRFVDEVKP